VRSSAANPFRSYFEVIATKSAKATAANFLLSCCLPLRWARGNGQMVAGACGGAGAAELRRVPFRSPPPAAPRDESVDAVRLVERGHAAETAAAPAGQHPDDMSLDAPPAPFNQSSSS
jgi:hypothetical protein